MYAKSAPAKARPARSAVAWLSTWARVAVTTENANRQATQTGMVVFFTMSLSQRRPSGPASALIWNSIVIKAVIDVATVSP